MISETQDTYFFLLDNFILPDEENWDKVKIVFNLLLSHWQNVISNLSTNKIAYLPFNFSDQYIECFKIKESLNRQVILQYGFTTKFDGTTLCPSQADSFKLELDEFVASSRYTNLATINKNDLIHDIQIAKNTIIKCST